MTSAVGVNFVILFVAEVTQLEQDVRDYRMLAVAESTRVLRKRQWACYARFCHSKGMDLLPCDPNRISIYVAFLARYMKPSSITAYLQGLVFYHVVNGLEPPDLSHPHIKATLEGVKNKLGRHSTQKDPLYISHIARMKNFVVKTDQPMWLTWVASLLMFRCLLRVGQVVKSPHMLRRRAVTFTEFGCILTLSSSKTLRCGEPPARIPINYMPSKEVCVVHYLRKLFRKFPAGPLAPLFSSKNCSSLSYSVFSSKLAYLLRASGCVGNFSSHSLRRGAATSMSELGFSITDIKNRGRWKSSCVNRYVKPSLSHAVTKDKKWASLL